MGPDDDRDIDPWWGTTPGVGEVRDDPFDESSPPVVIFEPRDGARCPGRSRSLLRRLLPVHGVLCLWC
jgi:hypothetical protein